MFLHKILKYYLSKNAQKQDNILYLKLFYSFIYALIFIFLIKRFSIIQISLIYKKNNPLESSKKKTEIIT